MTVIDAAKQLECSADLVYELCASGQLGHHRVGNGRGRLRITPEDVAAYVAARHVAPHAPGPDLRPAPARLVIEDYLHGPDPFKGKGSSKRPG